MDSIFSNSTETLTYRIKNGIAYLISVETTNNDITIKDRIVNIITNLLNQLYEDNIKYAIINTYNPFLGNCAISVSNEKVIYYDDLIVDVNGFKQQLIDKTEIESIDCNIGKTLENLLYIFYPLHDEIYPPFVFAQVDLLGRVVSIKSKKSDENCIKLIGFNENDEQNYDIKILDNGRIVSTKKIL